MRQIKATINQNVRKYTILNNSVVRTYGVKYSGIKWRVGGIEDAPYTGFTYVRRNGAWTSVELSNFVLKEEGKSLISDNELVRLENIKNYDDSTIRTLIGNKVDKNGTDRLISLSEVETFNGKQDALGFTPEQAGVADSLIQALKDGVSSQGNTLKKLYDLIISQYSEITVSTINERNAYNVLHLPTNIFVNDDGDGKWALYKATSTGVNATYIKLSDPDLLNSVMTASQIASAYESVSGVNRFTNTYKTELENAYSWGNHALAGYQTKTQTDLLYKAIGWVPDLSSYATKLQNDTYYLGINAQSKDSAKLGGNLPSYYQPAGNYLTGITSGQVIGALGYTPVSGTPWVSMGYLTAITSSQVTTAFGSQTANQIFASPNGSAGTPSFRYLQAADIPSGVSAYIWNQTSQQSATINVNGSVTASQFNGSGAGLSSIPISALTSTPWTGYLPLSGGTITGSLRVGTSLGDCQLDIESVGRYSTLSFKNANVIKSQIYWDNTLNVTTISNNVSFLNNVTANQFTGSANKALVRLNSATGGYGAFIDYDTNGSECMGFGVDNTASSFRFKAGITASSITGGSFMGITPDFEIVSGNAKVLGNNVWHGGNFNPSNYSTVSNVSVPNTNIAIGNSSSNGLTYVSGFYYNSGINIPSNNGYYINAKRFVYYDGTTYIGDIDNASGGSTIIRSGGNNAITLNGVNATFGGSVACTRIYSPKYDLGSTLYNLDTFYIANDNSVQFGTYGDTNVIGKPTFNGMAFDGFIMNFNWGSGTSNSYGSQIAFGNDNASGQEEIAFRGRDINGTQSAWKQIYHSGNIASLKTALGSILIDTLHSFNTNGYQKLSNGMILQWGQATANNTVYFPVAFTTRVFFIGACNISNNNTEAFSITSLTLSSFYLNEYGKTNTGNWFAIGY